MKNRAIIVLGMHRSGTSALTGLLGLLGADLGSSLLGASSANQAGYWEHRKVVSIHDRLLLELGSSWDDVSRLPRDWWASEAVAPYRAQLLELLAADFSSSPLWAVKDPRTCRLLPLWVSLLEELECEPLWLLLTRHPCENISSLEKRDGFSWEKSELLWLQHTLEAERATRGQNRVVVTFDQLLDNWQAAIERVRRAAGIPWPVPPESAAAQVAQFVDPLKRHHRAMDASRLSSWTRATYDALLSAAGAAGGEGAAGGAGGAGGEGAAGGGGRQLLEQRLAAVHASFEAADALYRPLLRGGAGEAEAQAADATAKYAQLQDALSAMRANYQKSKESLAAKSAELGALKAQSKLFERSPGGKLNRLLRRFPSKRRELIPRIDFPAVRKIPEASIIVTVGRNPAHTAQCLRSVCRQIAGGNAEVLAVADDSMAKELQHCNPLRIISTGKAMAFAESHNRAASAARGTFLIFLHDRLSAGEGWLDALLDPFRKMPDCGAVGPEAGNLKQDGAIQMLPQEGPLALREADFCTAACMAVPKNLFFQVGGFGGYYLPVEEASFGLKIRRTNRKVWQQPLCRVTRHGPQHRFDPERFESNRSRFVRHCAEALARQPA